MLYERVLQAAPKSEFDFDEDTQLSRETAELGAAGAFHGLNMHPFVRFFDLFASPPFHAGLLLRCDCSALRRFAVDLTLHPPTPTVMQTGFAMLEVSLCLRLAG